ncbi:ABC transporter ATP-binding protein [Acidaminobacter hydrogenoformans]|uniref:Putative ABC transport system ATP-binding protein n=1 Tax=Acidaminobacter hydrogenoformans DSM 2784 TaxID=1120920 RepID=A0A1G5S2K8_9FIRM|nr:ABC transporter ATP-binding protein [Acidaminobacter hydrogenoformans]SCZ80543.1 putative ABC transport system ATP-binding protein [Acidaminobacter hydrogenoformans DSM 2784]
MIDIQGLTKIYDTGSIQVEALRAVDFHVEEGDFVAIIGASGSGKSTLMNIIGCLDRPTSGRYVLDGVDVSSLNDGELAAIRNQKIGFVFQSFNLLARVNAIKNVELPLIYGRVSRAERHQRAMEALERVGLSDRIDHKPNELSGGQKQRVAIARALVTRPAIILADEPTGNLDSHSTEEIMEIFKRLNEEGVTLIIVTHEHEIADNAKRIITFKDGCIVKDERKMALEKTLVRDLNAEVTP